MDKTTLETSAFVLLFGTASLLIFLVFLPFVQMLALAAVLAILCRRPFTVLARLLGKSETFAAALLVCAVLAFFIVPLFFLGLQIFKEAQLAYLASQGNEGNYAQVLRTAIETPIRHLYPAFTFSISAYVAKALSFMSQNLGAFLSQTLFLLLETSLMLLAFFFFLRDGAKIYTTLVSLSPFQREHTDKILQSMEQTIGSVMRGTLLVALIRWACFGLAFYFLNIPNAMLWGIVGGIVGAVPGLGTLFVIIPAVVFLYLKGQMLAALLCGLLGLGMVVLVDNLLTTYFFGKGLEVPPIFIICSLLGGILFFGPMGFILGPLVLSLFLSTLQMYKILLLKK
ncbi:MAG: AI-2E family transporter [bacterium]